MRKTVLSLTMLLFAICAAAQGNDYYLPMTGIEFTFEIERRGPIDRTEYSFVSVRTSLFGVPDESKHYEAVIDNSNSIDYICKDEHGVLLGVNKKVKQPEQEKAKDIMERKSSEPDVVEISVIYIPVKEVKRVPLCNLLYDQGVFIGEGEPENTYYLTIKDNHDIYSPQATVKMSKAGKDNPNIYVNLPGKATMILEKGKNFLSSQELYLAQFGRVEAVDSKFFAKNSKYSLELNPTTGEIKMLK
ncbi:MAG: DUF4831 family protein [Prevotella sp.]|uniref:DUF4831 family protein n=1 Tax=Prevotella sp. TaxID=59823 RepID=UPI002A2AF34E|nr:DUF4831 family protein [Prevotella sp.]MDD7318917.1 DUF4831 family protein [Prevotellaceae bacterium]MDY4019943.1 DUF4831 family protein [Prevotella sp.]